MCAAAFPAYPAGRRPPPPRGAVMNEPIELTELQLDVMRVLWRRQGATTAEVHQELAPSRGLAFTTLATVLARMEKRGVVERANAARPYVYRARVTEPEVSRSMLGGLMDRLFGGDVAAMVSHLLGGAGVSAEDVRRVEAMVADKRREKEARHEG